MKFGAIDKVILFGGAPLLVATAAQLVRAGTDTLIYTSPRHISERIDERGTTLERALSALGLSFVVTDDINSESTIRDAITPTTLGIGLGEAWSFDADLIQRFGGRLLDFMGIPLPRYRGGAHYTWMILRGDRDGACNLQVINTDMIQGERDTGEIVKTATYRFPENARTPIDYFNAAVPEEVAFIASFLEDVRNGADFALRLPDESRSLFLPRLHTMVNGWIDWTMNGEDIERFICAFDEPYAGASTRVGATRVHLKGASLDKAERPFHPFQSGLITRITADEGFVVATRSGHLKVKTVNPTSGSSLPSELRVGDRFFTPSADLEAALAERISYGTKA